MPSPVEITKRILPEAAQSVIRPAYNRVIELYLKAKCKLGFGKINFEYDGSLITIHYTEETAYHYSNLVKDGRISTEGIQLSVLDTPRRVDSIIDVGAHVGTYSVLLGKLNSECDLYVFEPDKWNRRMLSRVLDSNDIEADVRPEVVTGETGVVTFYVDSKDGSQSHTTTKIDGFKPVNKPAVALSDVIKRNEVCDVFVKIDAEGGEFEILEDLFNAPLDSLHGLVELHPEKLSVPSREVIELLKHNCETVEFLGDTSPVHPQADKIGWDHNRPMYYFETRT